MGLIGGFQNCFFIFNPILFEDFVFFWFLDFQPSKQLISGC